MAAALAMVGRDDGQRLVVLVAVFLFGTWLITVLR